MRSATRYCVLALLLAAGCDKPPQGSGTVCFGDGLCQLPDGRYVDGDGDTPCAIDNSCTPTDTTIGDTGPGDPDPGDIFIPPACNQGGPDSDGDGISNACEDRNGNNIVESSETDPNSTDTDSDCILDGLEDANKNGFRDPGETNATRADSDGDGIPDGGLNGEDKNCNGVVDAYGEVGSQCTSLGQGACAVALICRWSGSACVPKLAACYEPGLDTAGESNPRLTDSDLDGIHDNVEDTNLNGTCDAVETCLAYSDSDCDGLLDGREDLNHNGVLNTGETDPRNPDTDGDLILDGIEDANRNGRWDAASETSARLTDSDGDGIRDGVEDANQDGIVQAFVDTNGNGCWDNGEAAGESDPRKLDTDGDNIDDRQEDNDRDGGCAASLQLDPFGSGQMLWTYQETCAFLADTDCDGLRDGQEDVNRNGLREVGELDAKRADTDLDGLADGCRAGVTLCEDANNNGAMDAGETNPLAYDTDGDLLGDGCELAFQPARCGQFCMDPLNDDSDGDGLADGEEDTNRNCRFDAGETDPRVPGPGCTDALSCARFEVCGTQNLKPITFATSNRPTHDYRLAFEVEFDAIGNSREYLVQPFGKDLTGDVFVADDPGDALWGVVVQAPVNVYDAAANTILSRDAYGFLLVTTTTTPKDLNTILDEVRADIAADPLFNIETALRETPRPTHDNLPNFGILRTQDEITLTLTAREKAVKVRKSILTLLLARYFGGRTPEPANVPPDADPAYEPTGSGINCPGNSRCYDRYSLSIAAVQRVGRDCTPYPDDPSCSAVGGCAWTGASCRPAAWVSQDPTTTQLVADPSGEPAVVFVVALTPDDASGGSLQFQRHADRKERLEDLTGGSALARSAAAVSKFCEGKPARNATADILWVVDDSLSMQQIIGRLQQAATNARTVLSASAAVVDFRTALTTTNNSIGARTFCLVTGTPGECNATCGPTTNTNCNRDCADQTIGCLTSTVPATILADADNPTQAAIPGNDLSRYPLPGGGGTFYFEDTEYLDCIAKAGDAGQQVGAGCPVGESCTGGVCSGGGTCNARFLNTCAKHASLASFFNPDGVADPDTLPDRKRLLANAGFLGSTGAACASAAMDLLYDVSATQPAACLTDSNRNCERLVDACTDGPTVLASQMCDLIRAMGGLPCQLALGQTSSSRRHSAPEYGSRAARRLLDKLAPALPGDSPDPNAKLRLRLDCNTASSSRACGSDLDCDNDERCLGLTCTATGNCRTCSPGQTLAAMSGIASCTEDGDCWAGERCNTGTCVWDCRVVPVVTVVLSDEEDFYLKDDCRDDARVADKSPLPVECRYVDGDPTDAEPCTLSYCTAGGLRTGIPQGHDPDLAAQTSDSGASVLWRTVPAPAGSACSAAYADRNVSCLGDPCPYQANAIDCLNGEYGNICAWTVVTSICKHNCTGSTLIACTANPQCRWERALVRDDGNIGDACLPAYPLNDCQPCKRFLRTEAAVTGSDGRVGFGNLGPVYAIVRDAGVQAYGVLSGTTVIEQDPCNGGGATWGRGDGQAYRDLATRTQGVTTNVCTTSSQGYAPFMQRLINDIATLSAPYKLARSPIAATLKVGIARPGGTPSANCTASVGAGYVFCPVPRSRTSGFFYDPSANSLGFAVPATGGVPDYIPQEGDTVFVSYRYWLDVPCREECGPDETCLRLFCPESTATVSCGTTPDCPALGQECVSNVCTYPCVPGEFLDICICGRCGSCETCDVNTGACAFTNADPCVCNPRSDVCESIADENTCNSVADCLWKGSTSTCELGAACDPSGINACQPGFFCNSSCACERASCAAGFRPDGTANCTNNCAAALACCGQWAQANDPSTGCASIAPMTSGNCTDGTPPRCRWTGTTCEPEAPACCLPTETPECYLDPEIGLCSILCRSTLSCLCGGNPATCDALGQTGACACVGPGDCEPWQTCDSGTGLCTPACHPQLEECGAEAGACRCLPIPP